MWAGETSKASCRIQRHSPQRCWQAQASCFTLHPSLLRVSHIGLSLLHWRIDVYIATGQIVGCSALGNHFISPATSHYMVANRGGDSTANTIYPRRRQRLTPSLADISTSTPSPNGGFDLVNRHESKFHGPRLAYEREIRSHK